MNNVQQFEVAVIGLGYIGLPTAAFIASKGINVLGVDINPAVVETISKGEIHIVEPNLKDIVKKVVKSGHLQITTKVETANSYLIVVPTPFKHNHRADVSYVENATKMVLPYLKQGDLFIIESTSPVKTTEKIADFIFKERPELKDAIYISYCPERVLPGNVIYELEANDRVIGGINEESTKKAIAFYSKFVKGTLHSTNSRTAEMCKLVENSSRDVQIAFANELSIICDKIGIDIWDLIKLANKHPRVNILKPSCGVGGHCIAVDPWFIISDFPEQAQIIKRSRETNDYKADWCVNRVVDICKKFSTEKSKEPIIACMGLAFKPNIDDLRESPAIYITSRLVSEADAQILVSEPNIASHKTFNLLNYMEAYQNADIIVWLVAHKQFYDIPKNDSKIELDFCGMRSV
jgi:UDP-N-acetyl-D-mannosaminuronic acid dehydrogenase